tara:strand:+ start:120 stop:389 length:270 start_codon:yes stop_codon:yes gene_type:complete
MKNKKIKYVTVKNKEGLDYRSIANIMTEKGDKMNHATVRNIINKSLVKIVKGLHKDMNKNISEKDAYNIAKSPEFQIALKELLERERNG